MKRILLVVVCLLTLFAAGSGNVVEIRGQDAEEEAAQVVLVFPEPEATPEPTPEPTPELRPFQQRRQSPFLKELP